MTPCGSGLHGCTELSGLDGTVDQSPDRRSRRSERSKRPCAEAADAGAVGSTEHLPTCAALDTIAAAGLSDATADLAAAGEAGVQHARGSQGVLHSAHARDHRVGASCWPATASFWSTTLRGSLPTLKRSTPTRGRARSIRSSSVWRSPASRHSSASRPRVRSRFPCKGKRRLCVLGCSSFALINVVSAGRLSHRGGGPQGRPGCRI